MQIPMLMPVTRHILFAVGYATLGIVLGAGTFLALVIESGPDLETWHLAPLDKEYRADKNKTIQTLDQYRKLENELFRELDKSQTLQDTEQVAFVLFRCRRVGDGFISHRRKR